MSKTINHPTHMASSWRLNSPTRRASGRWKRLLTVGLILGLAAVVQTVRADLTVMDDDFNNATNNLANNSDGIGGGYNSFTAIYGFVRETNSVVEVGNTVNGAGRAVIASQNYSAVNANGTVFEFRNVSFTNTSTGGTPNTDRLIIGVLATNTAGDWFESGLSSMPEGFYIEPNSDSIARQLGGTGNNGWADHNSVLFYKSASTNVTILAEWQFQNLNWNQGYTANYSPVLDVQLTLSATGWALDITGDVNTNGQPISFSSTYADSGITNILVNGINNPYIGGEGQTEAPCIQMSIDRILVTHQGDLIVTTPKISGPNVVFDGTIVDVSSFVTDSVATPTIQWQISDPANPGVFTNLPSGSATNVTIDTTGLGGSQPRGVRLVADDTMGNSVTSSVVSLNIRPPGAPQPVQFRPIGNGIDTSTVMGLYAGQGVRFVSEFVGSPPITYQWRVSMDGGSSYSDIIGATNDTYAINSFDPADDGYAWQIVAHNEHGDTTAGPVYTLLLPGVPEYLWSATIPFIGLNSDQILTNFPGTYVAGALVAKNGGAPILVTNSDGSVITFAGSGAWASLSGGSGYGTGANTNSTGNASFDSCLNDRYSDNGTHTITMSGLVVGQEYQLQVFALDDRLGNGGRTTFWQATNAYDLSQTYVMGDHAYVLGTFTASNTVQTLEQTCVSNVGNFNCLVLRAVGWEPPPYFTANPVDTGGLVGTAAVSFSGNAAGDTTIANPTISYQWVAGPPNGPFTNLVEGAKYAGTTTSTLTISNLTAADGIPVYALVATDSGGSTTGKVVHVYVQSAPVPPQPGSYGAYAISTNFNNLVAFWQLNETNDPSTGQVLAYDFTGNGHNGTYGTAAQNRFNGIMGPTNLPGFAADQGALGTTGGNAGSVVTLPPLNLSTNITDATITMWIKPNATPPNAAGLLFVRGSTVAGFGYANGGVLGYNWNDSQGSWGWNSPLTPPLNTWSFVALVIQTNQATIYLNYIDSNGQTQLLSAVHANAQTPVAWNNGTITLGTDPLNGGGGRVFPGAISDTAIYNSAFTPAQILQLFGKGLQVAGFPPQISGLQDSYYTLPIPSGKAVNMTATVGGTAPLSYGWMFNGASLMDGPFMGATISGAYSNSLTINNLTVGNTGPYELLVTNPVSVATSKVVNVSILPATLVGQWLTISNSLADVSGFSPTNTHDATVQSGSVYWTNDVPPSAPPGSASLYFNNAGLMVANSSTLDAGYTNTFDNKINNGMTVMCWAKGWPGGWNPFVSKYGDNGLGWQLRSDGSGGNPGYATWTVRGGGGAVRIGAGVYGNAEDLATRSINTKDDQWHHYAATYSPLTGVRSLYVDGKLAAYETGQGPLNRTTASHLMIGARDNGGNNFQAYFTGEMYDVRVYDYALPQSQVVAAKNGQNLPVPGQDFFATSGQTATFTTPAVSAAPPYMGYRWQLNGANLTDGANDGATISGSSTLALTVSNLTANNTGVYQLLVTNTSGVTTDSIVNVGIVPPSEVGRWLSGSVSNLTDVSGFSPAGVHDASVQSGSVYWTNDVPNGAPAGSYSLGFNNAGLIVSNSSTWDPGYTNTFDNMIQNGMTVMLWAKGVPGGWNPWVSKFGDNALGWQLRVNNGGVPTWTIRGTGGNEDMSGNKASDGNWHHYTGTYSPVTGVRSLYVDGVLVATQTNQGPYNMTSSSHLMIGAKDSGGNTYGSQFTGRIYDVRVYNYPLTQSELAAVVPGLTPSFTAKQIISGASGGQLVLTWPFGTLLEATNVAGPWTTNNVTSPYTNDLTLPQEFFKLQNP